MSVNPYKAEAAQLRDEVKRQDDKIGQLQAHNRTLRARVAELQEANDYLQGIVNDDGEEDARIRARVAELEEGLRPFQKEADRIDPLPHDPMIVINDNVELWQSGSPQIARTRITYGDIRRARALLTTAGETHDPR